ncbi:MAG: hypothetical protein J6T28_04035, partial [Paludibacteraceae bacterium]|nr:hypothetical protein [Paludibacteraceae bacterium]
MRNGSRSNNNINNAPTHRQNNQSSFNSRHSAPSQSRVGNGGAPQHSAAPREGNFGQRHQAASP